MGQWLSERLGQPIIVENRPGAAGNIGTEIGVRAPPDGYTLLMALSVNAINASVYDSLPFNFIRDTAPVASIASIPLVMEVNPSVSAKTVPEFIAYAKANAGKINFSALVLKVMETLKVTEAPLPGSVCAPVQRSFLAEFPRASAELPGASAELPRASEESSARLRGAWRCCPPLVAGQPRLGLRADPRSGAWRQLLP
jgi:hypothetical protein